MFRADTDAWSSDMRKPACTLPKGHDGRHWNAGKGFFRTDAEELAARPPRYEFEQRIKQIACATCKGKGEIYDVEDEEMMGCPRCKGSGMKAPRGQTVTVDTKWDGFSDTR